MASASHNRDHHREDLPTNILAGSWNTEDVLPLWVLPLASYVQRVR